MDPSPQPLKWFRISERWSQQLEKLANTHEDDKVVKVGNVVMGKGGEFCIAKGSDGTEVFLGLRDDGTEVAVKRISKSKYEVLKTNLDCLQKLDDPSIVRYVDFAEDEHFGYIGLQLCEFTLEEYIRNKSVNEPRKLAAQFLKGLAVLHFENTPILHWDIKPDNVLIDIKGNAKTNFGIGCAGTICWKAKETVTVNKASNIQVAGMLIYYILSGGHHPFGSDLWCQGNIYKGLYKLDHVQDVIAKDLIEMMINEDPKKRPTVEECLAHPYFWGNEKRLDYLRKIGNEREVERCRDADKNLIAAFDRYAEMGQINAWKEKFPPELLQLLGGPRRRYSYPENVFGLLRFMRNLLEHYAEAAAHMDLMEMFPGLFDCVYLFVKDQGWNTRVTLKWFMATNINTLEKPLDTKRKWNRISKRWSQHLEALANTTDNSDKIVKVGNVVIGIGDEFRIVDESEVFLALRGNGTEVAVKRMLKRNFKQLENEKDILCGIDDPSIVRYWDFVEDKNFGYLCLQLCEYTLEDYVKKPKEFPRLCKKEIAEQVLKGLNKLHCQDRPILHRDIKPQNVLIDSERKARLADFGISRRLTRGQTTHSTSSAGTKCWMAKEIINEDGGVEHVPYKISADIQVAGMLLYYILSGGEHPFGSDLWCQVNIYKGLYKLDHVQDVVAKDLIERMINEDPKKRPKVEECLDHPYFLDNEKRVDFLRKVATETEMDQFHENSEDVQSNLMTVLDQCAEKGLFDEWKGKMRDKLPEEVEEMERRNRRFPYRDDGFGLLRFIQNLYRHHKAAAEKLDLTEMFPGLIVSVYMFVKELRWNTRRDLKGFYKNTNLKDSDGSSLDGALSELSLQSP